MNPFFVALFIFGWIAPAAVALTLWALAYRFKEFGVYVAATVIGVTLAIVSHITISVFFFDSVALTPDGNAGVAFGWAGWAVTTLWTSIQLPFVEYKRRAPQAAVARIRRAS